MANLILTPENQIQRLNHILHYMGQLGKVPPQKLTTALGEGTWSVVEVVEHLNIAYSFYQEKIERALDAAARSDQEPWTFKARAWQRMVIEGQRPRGTKRPYKMKTLKRFRPMLGKGHPSETQIIPVLKRFHSMYGHLKESILISRAKVMQSQKINSAIGPLVRFYLPEAFEFLICHAERHRVQIEGILSKK